MQTSAVAPTEPKQRRRSYLLGVLGGIVAKLGVSTALVAVLIFADQFQAARFDRPILIDRMDDPRTTGWYLLQGVNFVSAGLAGFVAAWLSPKHSRGAAATLVALAVLAIVFAQLPRPASTAMLVLWAAGAPVGIVIGSYLFRRRERAA